MVRLTYITFALLSVVAAVRAHPVVENAMDVVVAQDRISLRARIALTEIDVASPIDDLSKINAAVDQHGRYLLGHLHVSADGEALDGTLLKSSPPAARVTDQNFEQQFATYEIEYTLPASRPQKIRIEEDLLKEFSRLGQPWTVLFVAQVREDGETKPVEMLLSRDAPLEFNCRWNNEAAPRASTWRTAGQYLAHGAHHILTGYDHLLFVAALVLAATKLWDLVTVVTAFAIAHTLTLTLAVLHLVRLPSSIVEPIIAASIIFVALQNVLFPEKSRGPARLAVAFAFGLFHGLGFAGGLMDAMAEMPATSLTVALISFTIGVELAHQLLIMPLFMLLKPLRRTAEMSFQLRFASVAISLAGMFFLVSALREAAR